MKLKVYHGMDLLSENVLLDLPTSVAAFLMERHELCVPAVGVAAGPYIYVYKNMRPYFRYALPPLEVNSTEKDVWEQAKEVRRRRKGLGKLSASQNPFGHGSLGTFPPILPA